MPCLKASSVGKLLLDVGEPRVDVGVGHRELARARLLREQVIGDQLIEHAAQHLVALVRRHRRTGARFHALHRVVELPALDLLAVDSNTLKLSRLT